MYITFYICIYSIYTYIIIYHIEYTWMPLVIVFHGWSCKNHGYSGSWSKQLKTATKRNIFPMSSPNGMENRWCDGNQDFSWNSRQIPGTIHVCVSWNLVFRPIHDLAPKINRSTAWHEKPHFLLGVCYPLIMTNIAIENGPFIVDFPIKNGNFP